MVAGCKPCSTWQLEVNSVEKEVKEKPLDEGSRKVHCIKVKLTWFKKSFHLHAAGEGKGTACHLSKVNFYVSTVTGKP